MSKCNKGIYRIICTKTGSCYIGATTNLRSRKYSHFNALKNDKHPNQNLQTAYHEFGEDAFEFEVLEHVEKEENLPEREYFHLTISNNNYNVVYCEPKQGMPKLQREIESRGIRLNWFAENVLGMTYLKMKRRMDNRSFTVDEIKKFLNF